MLFSEDAWVPHSRFPLLYAALGINALSSAVLCASLFRNPHEFGVVPFVTAALAWPLTFFAFGRTAKFTEAHGKRGWLLLIGSSILTSPGWMPLLGLPEIAVRYFVVLFFGGTTLWFWAAVRYLSRGRLPSIRQY